MNKIQLLTQDDLDTISEYSVENSQVSKVEFQCQAKKMDKIMSNPRLLKAIEAYKCYYDKCELLMIAANKISSHEELRLTEEIEQLSKYSIMFVSMMFLHRLAESMNKNLNFLDL